MLIATHNRGKIREYRELLRELCSQLVGLDDVGITEQAEETGDSFAENALAKARAYAQLSGHVTLADDSGLEVDALCKRPGVYSARYGGPGLTDEQRYLKLLTELEDLGAADRRARFRCAIAVAWPDGRCALTTGSCEGEIASEPLGANGFGYDPVFYIPEYQRTMAELPETIKNRISHRARAARAMVELLRNCTAGPEL